MFLSVPSCPRIMSRDLKTTSSSVNISWQCPKYYNQSVTSYRIAVNHQDEPLLMENKTSSLSNITLDCSMDTAISQIRPSCIKLTKHVKDVNVTDPLCKGPVCKTTIKGLINYVDYQVEVQACLMLLAAYFLVVMLYLDSSNESRWLWSYITKNKFPHKG